MGENLLHGLTALGNFQAIGYLFIGALVGMVIGVIPGLGGAVVLSIILAFIYHVNLIGTLCLFLGTQAGSYYSASVSSILLNTPAHPEAFPITFDGYPMARNGQPARALGISACSTCIGGFIGCAILVGFIPFINDLPYWFHPPEYVALVTLAMLLVGTLGTDSLLKAIASAGAGLVVASIGPSIITGVFRYNFGAIGLFGGISLVALALGVFAVPQMIMIFGTGTTVARQDMTGKEVDASEPVVLSGGFGRQVIAGVGEAFRHWVVLIQSGIVGGLTGIIPGIGGFTGNFLAYGVAKQTSRRERRALFGTGIPEGIIAPEGSSLAKEAGHMVPILGLGIPGGVGGALFLAALTIKSIKVGYGFTTNYPLAGYEIVWIIALSGLIGTVAGVLIGPQLARVTQVPGPLIVPFVLALCVVGPFLADVEFFSVVEVLVFAILGLALRRLRYPLGSFILGLVLGPTFETNVFLTRKLHPGVSFVAHSPLADVLFAISIVVLVLKAREIWSDYQSRQAVLASELAVLQSESERNHRRRVQALSAQPYPLLALVVTLALLGLSLFFIVYGVTNYSATTATMPVVGGLLVALPMTVMLPKDLRRYVHYRQFRAEVKNAQDLTIPATDSSVTQSSVTEASDLDKIPRPTSQSGFPDIREKEWGWHGQYTRELLAFAWLAGIVGACWLFGFVWGIPLFMACYGLTSTGRYLSTWFRRLIFTGVSTAVMWIVTFEMINIVHLVFTPKIHL